VTGAKGSPSVGPSLLYVSTVSSTMRHFLRPYAAHFRAKGWRVDAAASGFGAHPDHALAFDHVSDIPLSRSILDVRGNLRGERAIEQIIREMQPDLVHVHTPIASFLTRLAVRRMPAARRPKVAYTAHGFHFHKGGQPITNAIFRTAERTAGRWTDRLVVINDEDEAAARRLHIVPPGKLVRMPGIGLDTGWYAPASISPEVVAAERARLELPAAGPAFLVIGELNANKRQADAIAALAVTEHQDAQLVFLGAGRERLPLEELARERGLSDRVHFGGLVEDVRPTLLGAISLITTSKREGLSRSVMEALALEIPVVASSARGNAELVGEDGFVVETGDAQALAGAMDWLVEHPAEAREFGRRGRQRMVERYDLSQLIARHEALYAGMLAERA
jgi:glycosyltransferase involved in cell wall biosynthesis